MPDKFDEMATALLETCSDMDLEERISIALRQVAQDVAREMQQRCAEVARAEARAISKGSRPRCGSVEEIGSQVAAAIEAMDLSEVGS